MFFRSLGNVIGVIDWHSYGEKIIRPYGMMKLLIKHVLLWFPNDSKCIKQNLFTKLNYFMQFLQSSTLYVHFVHRSCSFVAITFK